MSGITLLFYITGLLGDTVNPLVAMLLEPESMTSFSFYATMATLIGTSAAAIYIGFIQKNAELAVATAMAPVLIALLWSFIDVFNKLKSINMIIAILVLAPLLLMFFITILDWWRGRD